MSGSSFNPQSWENGELCSQHGVPYCISCCQALIRLHYASTDKLDDAAVERIRTEVMWRIMGRANSAQHALFYRPKPARNLFLDSRKRKFAASCQLGTENFLVVPIEFAIIGDDHTAHKADDDETRAILTKEHLWDISTPEWIQHDIPQLDDEDSVLLREFQLFKS